MLFRPVKEPAPELDPRFKVLDPALFEMLFHGEFAGYLSVRADVMFTAIGPWWRDRWVNPRPACDWTAMFDQDYLDEHAAPWRQYYMDDGIESGTEMFEELLTGTLNLRGVIFELRHVERGSKEWTDNYVWEEKP